MKFSQARHILAGGAAALVLLMGGPCLADTVAKVDHNYPLAQPSYPDSAQLAGEQGDVMVGVYVSRSGRPRNARIVQSSGFRDLDEAAEEAAVNWRYIPATEDGDTVSSWTTVKLHFELPKPVPASVPAPAPASH
jgi:TonB family protein